MNSKVYAIVTGYCGSGEPSQDTVSAICTTRLAAEATVERIMREHNRDCPWAGHDFYWRVDEYQLCVTPNEAYDSKVTTGDESYQGCDDKEPQDSSL
jgi:hypothetical protein